MKLFSFWSIWVTCKRISHVDWGGELFTSATWFKEEIEKFIGSSKLDLKTVVLHTRSASCWTTCKRRHRSRTSPRWGNLVLWGHIFASKTSYFPYSTPVLQLWLHYKLCSWVGLRIATLSVLLSLGKQTIQERVCLSIWPSIFLLVYPEDKHTTMKLVCLFFFFHACWQKYTEPCWKLERYVTVRLIIKGWIYIPVVAILLINATWEVKNWSEGLA